MDVAELDRMEAAEAGSMLRTCADIPRWVDALVAERPYGDLERLLARADELAADWTGDEVLQALADHPRIGERHQGAAAAARLSAREQAGVDPADTEVQARLLAGNRAYEERFGWIFLVRAAGRSATEMLAELDRRLANDPATELEETGGQLREIAALRLRGLFA
jgi:2-oxo-4-hydroxy-4-carboxy-5-ureidoimidazoline decarboxylase